MCGAQSYHAPHRPDATQSATYARAPPPWRDGGQGRPDLAKGSPSAQFGMGVGAKGMGRGAALAGHIKQLPVPGGGGFLPGLWTGDTNESFSTGFN